MFLHLGSNEVVRAGEIVAILNVASPGLSGFIGALAGRQVLHDISHGNAKSLVVATDRAFLSPISSLTLKRRLELFLRGPA